MKTLVLITSQYPFGTGESFIAPEIPFLLNNFDKTIIISQNTSSSVARNISGNAEIYRYNTATSFKGFLSLPVLFILNSSEIIEMLKGEIAFRLELKNKLTIGKFFYLFRKIIKAFQLRDFIISKLTENKISGSIVFYSYWFKTGAHAISLLNYPNSIKIARAHGSDIYEEKTERGYLPLLRFTATKLDSVFFISKQGKRYIEEKTKSDCTRFLVSCLGTEKPAFDGINRIESEKFVIVSCSNMVPLKRINLIIDALSGSDTGKKIHWLHFGDGILKEELELNAAKKLGPKENVSYRFMGYCPNEDLLKYYSANRVDLFINTSTTEGVPVSIMEVQSYGIPVIATDTGGVKEIVTEGTGSLLPVDFQPEELTALIRRYATLSDEETDTIRMNAYMNWTLNFNAAVNYSEFITRVNRIFATSKAMTER